MYTIHGVIVCELYFVCLILLINHNYIISNVDYNIMERLDRRVDKFIYTILHTINSTVQSIVIVNCCYIQTQC